jgi:hypothetical protein
MKAKYVLDGSGEKKYVAIRCPACKHPHLFTIINDGRPRWEFNHNMEAPTFTPSMLCTWTEPSGDKRCHSYVTDGKIQFLSDCTHDLKNQTVELPEYDGE